MYSLLHGLNCCRNLRQLMESHLSAVVLCKEQSGTWVGCLFSVTGSFLHELSLGLSSLHKKIQSQSVKSEQNVHFGHFFLN